MSVSLVEVVLLAGAGAAGGYLAGLVGVGGGIIYAPVLLYYFHSIGIQDPLLTPLTLGTSLLCVTGAAVSGVLSNRGPGRIAWRPAIVTGLLAAVATALTGHFVTTQPWYDRHAFQLVLGAILVWVVYRMLRGKQPTDEQLLGGQARRDRLILLVPIGIAVGVLVAAAGVGGGVLLVPLFSGVLRIPIKQAMASSLGAILIVSLAGVLTYMMLGLGAASADGTIGYVDFWSGLLLGLPAVLTAPMGVRTARRVDVKYVRYAFATVASLVAIRLIGEAVGVF